MATETKTASGILEPDDIQVMAEAIAAGRSVAPEVSRRIRDCSRKIKEELLREYGVRKIAVDLIRQGSRGMKYLTLAKREQSEFVTADEKLIRNLQPRFPFIRPLSSIP